MLRRIRPAPEMHPAEAFQRLRSRSSTAHVLLPLTLLMAAATLAPSSITAVPQRPDSAPAQVGVGDSDSHVRFHISATHRTRYGHLWNQFRPAITGNDMALSLRTTLLGELRFHFVAVGTEMADSRVYLSDDDMPLNTSLVNPIDFLQVYIAASIPHLLADDALFRIRVGRQSMDVSSRRLIARNRFRNTINAFTGLDMEWTSSDQRSVRAFLTVPVQRRLDSLRDNEIRLDLERMESVVWGISLGSRTWSDAIRVEFNLLGIHERDSEEFPTNNRTFVTSGLRLFRAPRPGRLDFELEALMQAGRSRLTPLSEDTTDLRHFAFFVHCSLGRTFTGKLQPRLVLQYDYATGDKDPFDDANGRFDTLFGARRFEFGPTGIYGAFTRSNINSPAVRAEVQPHRKLDGFLAYRPAWLAQARDRWITTLIWDTEGMSGTALGHQIEGRLRWLILPENITLEAGFAHLVLGEFPKKAPNGNPDAKDPTYIYAQVLLRI
ncbi:MAG: alginate export family protein [Gemmatimonadota bacterium]|nr:MAG: alginate export family protein [Gemmatimonadota bacterium]